MRKIGSLSLWLLLITVSICAQKPENETCRLFQIKPNGKAGYINKIGKIIVPPQFDYGFEFYEGLAAVEKDGKWGYVDCEGKMAIPLILPNGYYFADGLARIKVNGKYGFINRKGQIVIQPRFDAAWMFLRDWRT